MNICTNKELIYIQCSITGNCSHIPDKKELLKQNTMNSIIQERAILLHIGLIVVQTKNYITKPFNKWHGNIIFKKITIKLLI